MSQPANSLILPDPPAHNTRGRQQQATPSTSPAVMAEAQPGQEAAINTLIEQINTMSVSDSLSSFCANKHEVNAWLARFESLARAKGWLNNRHDKLPVYLEANEHEWYDGLPEEAKASYESLKAALIAEYTPKAASKFERETLLRARKQSQNTSVKDFTLMVRREARAISLPEDKGVEIVLNNMLPAARATIVNIPQTYEAILATPVARGEIPLPTNNNNTDTEAVIKQLLAALVDKNVRIAALEARRPSTPSAPPAVASQQPWTDEQRPWTDRQQQWTSSPQQQQWTSGPQQQQQQQQWTSGPRQQPWRQPPPQQRTRAWPPPGPAPPPRRMTRPPPLSYRAPTTNGPCSGCGSSKGRCIPREACPAHKQICHHCGKENHLDVVCRTNPDAVIRIK